MSFCDECLTAQFTAASILTYVFLIYLFIRSWFTAYQLMYEFCDYFLRWKRGYTQSQQGGHKRHRQETVESTNEKLRFSVIFLFILWSLSSLSNCNITEGHKNLLTHLKPLFSCQAISNYFIIDLFPDVLSLMPFWIIIHQKLASYDM